MTFNIKLFSKGQLRYIIKQNKINIEEALEQTNPLLNEIFEIEIEETEE